MLCDSQRLDLWPKSPFLDDCIWFQIDMGSPGLHSALYTTSLSCVFVEPVHVDVWVPYDNTWTTTNLHRVPLNLRTYKLPNVLIWPTYHLPSQLSLSKSWQIIAQQRPGLAAHVTRFQLLPKPAGEKSETISRMAMDKRGLWVTSGNRCLPLFPDLCGHPGTIASLELLLTPRSDFTLKIWSLLEPFFHGNSNGLPGVSFVWGVPQLSPLQCPSLNTQTEVTALWVSSP